MKKVVEVVGAIILGIPAAVVFAMLWALAIYLRLIIEVILACLERVGRKEART